MREAVVAIVATIAATAIINAYGVFSDLKTIPDDVKELNQRVTSLSTNIESYKAQFQSQLSELLILKGQFQEFEKNQIFFAPTVYPTDNDGYVQTLYVGRFVNGKFNETEHDSWEITRKTADGDLNKKYEYFKGNFKDNNKLIDEFMIFKPTLEINDIKELIEGVYFQPRLIWYGEGI